MALLASISAESCVCAFLSTWISRLEVLADLTYDRRAQFTSSVWSPVCSSLGSLPPRQLIFIQSTGMIEHFHCSPKSALRSPLASSDWFLHLPLVLLGLRMVPKDDTGLSVSEAVDGFPLTIPGEFLGSPALPLSRYLSKIGCAVAGFTIPLPHHVFQSPPHQLPAALMSYKYVFVQEDLQSLPYA